MTASSERDASCVTSARPLRGSRELNTPFSPPCAACTRERVLDWPRPVLVEARPPAFACLADAWRPCVGRA
eukprot:329786-Pleurochrysis_carterae.AAC.1